MQNVKRVPAQVEDGPEQRLAYAHFRYEMEGACIIVCESDESESDMAQ